jgi:excisionase family DNA binding protein
LSGERRVGCAVVARILGVSDRTVRRYCEDGLIPPAHYHLTPGGHYRIDLDQVQRILSWVEESRTSRTATQEEAS